MNIFPTLKSAYTEVKRRLRSKINIFVTILQTNFELGDVLTKETVYYRNALHVKQYLRSLPSFSYKRTVFQILKKMKWETYNI